MCPYEEQTDQVINADTAPITPLMHKVAFFKDELDERRRQLNDDLAYFELKLKELNRLDPLDFTGLAQIYVKHAESIRHLLGTSEGATLKTQ